MTIPPFLISIKPLQSSQTEGFYFHVNHSYLQEWGIKSDTSLTLCFGKKSIKAKAIGSESPPKELFLTENVMKELFIPSETLSLYVYYIPQTETILLGPVIALLTEISENQDGSPNFRSVHAFSEEIHHGLRELGGVFYVFSLDDYSKENVTGYYFQDGSWTKKNLPLPDVIYNRIHSRKLEYASRFQELREHADERNIAIFNHRFLSKWEVHNMLLVDEKMHPYLPNTSLYSKNRLKELLADHQALFLKPVHGSQGRNILRLSKEEDHFVIESSDKKNNLCDISDLSQLFLALQQRIKKRLYLIQEEIPLITYDGRKLDFRILCHKNHQDGWEVTSCVARVSARQQFVSNLSRGGELLKPLKVLADFFDSSEALQIFSLMKEIAVKCAAIIEQQSNGLTGELGIDMGVDPSGNIWIIEANSKPSKNLEEENKQIRPSARAIIRLCCALAFNYRKEKEE